MVEIPLATLKAIARQLNELGVSWTFTGRSIIGLLMDEPALGTTRPTDDVAVIIEILAQKDYANSFQRHWRLPGSTTLTIQK